MTQDKQRSFDTVVFDLDGVITKTALVHAASWKHMFDDYMKLRESRDKEPFKEFTVEGDYRMYVDGKPRYKGVRSFLESRGINLEEGDPSDEPDKETVCGLGNKKNVVFRQILEKDGVEIYAIKRWMGHSSLKTTYRYIHLSPDYLSKIKSPLDMLSV